MFGVVRGGTRLRQECVFSSLLLNVLFAAILLVALGSFSKEIDILCLADLIHLQEQSSKVGPRTALECVRRAT